MEQRGWKYTYKDVMQKPIREELMEAAPNARTVPQIFYNGFYIGGYSDLTSKMESGVIEQHMNGEVEILSGSESGDWLSVNPSVDRS
jgi:glutaredoxin 3